MSLSVASCTAAMRSLLYCALTKLNGGLANTIRPRLSSCSNRTVLTDITPFLHVRLGFSAHIAAEWSVGQQLRAADPQLLCSVDVVGVD